MVLKILLINKCKLNVDGKTDHLQREFVSVANTWKILREWNSFQYLNWAREVWVVMPYPQSSGCCYFEEENEKRHWRKN